MGSLFNFLQSKGKTGGVILMVLGVVMFVMVGIGKLDNSYLPGATAAFGTGLGVFGIRSALPPSTP